MKKKMLFIILVLVFFVYPNLVVEAMKPDQITSRNECPNIELAEAKSDGSLAKVECYDDYGTAKGKMNESQNDNLVLIEQGKIIDAKYALVDYDCSFKNASIKYVRVFNSTTSNKEAGYIRTAGNYADDAVMLDYDYNSKRVKIKVSDIVGWINKYDNSEVLYDVVPLVWVKTAQYYQVGNNSISHYFPGNVYGEKGSYSMTIDLKPEMLNPGKYYSYDGHYFYTDLKVLINDYKNGVNSNSINRDNPYFNYYQYLSFRTKSNYNADNINQFLRSRISKDTSKMLNTGEAFTWVQENYGVNAVLMMSIGINESGWGNSEISQTKNNLFGLNAVDSTPGESANYFPNVETCIKDYGYKWLSYWYLQPGDSHYTGANLGNKYEGLNVKYASDPFWGESAAHYYYEIDKTYGFQDRDKNIAVLNGNYNGEVYARKTPGGEKIRIYDKNDFYQYKLFGTAVSVISEVKDQNGNIWYKIQSEPVLDNNLNYIGDSNSNPRINYNWNSYVYVEARYFLKVKVASLPQETVNIDTGTGTSTQTVPVSTIVSNANYKYENGIIDGIKFGTNVITLTGNIANSGGSNIAITYANGTAKPSDALLATGDKINITSSNITETLEIIVSGDTDGDGDMTAMDYVNIKNHIMESHILSGVYLKAADVDNDGTISAMDYVSIKNYIMNQ